MEEALKRLEMPEVMTKRKPIEFVHSEDALLIDHDEDGADYVFTDISTSKNMRVSNNNIDILMNFNEKLGQMLQAYKSILSFYK